MKEQGRGCAYALARMGINERVRCTCVRAKLGARFLTEVVCWDEENRVQTMCMRARECVETGELSACVCTDERVDMVCVRANRPWFA